MKRFLFLSALALITVSCNPIEQPAKTNQVPDTSTTELKNQIIALQQTIDTLKSQVEFLTSGIIEIDGLRFDQNGTLISVPKLGNVTVQTSGDLTLTTTRSYDAKGRVIEIKSEYSGRPIEYLPYAWQKTIYEYNGKKCKAITQTHRYGLAAGIPYEEEIFETTYW